MCKNETILKEIIFKYHPDYQKSRVLKTVNPNHFNVEHLIEETLSIVGKYKHINAAHADFSDGSDSKTASISITPNFNRANIFAGCIGNVVSRAGVQKIGALRCIIYNPHYSTLMYYYLPKSFWETILETGKANSNKIRFTYNIGTDEIAKFERFRKDDFEELAKAKK